MKKCAVVLGLLALILAGVPARGQAQLTSSSLHMTVTTADGQALPGATVTVAGPGAPRLAVSAADGKVRFLGLPSGTYTMTIELEGFATTTRTVRVVAGRGLTLETTLSLATSDEDIVVTGGLPVTDTTTTLGTTITGDLVDALPTARTYQDFLDLVPGVQTDRVAGGGHDIGLYTSFTRPGGGIDQNRFVVDGVDITDMSGLGVSPTYFDFQPFDVMDVVTGGGDATLSTSGIVVNVVTKSGGSELAGSVDYVFHGGSVFSALDPDPVGPDAIHQQALDSSEAFSAALGGPIVEDTLWFFAAAGSEEISRFGVSGQQQTPTDYAFTGMTGKVDGRVAPSNTLTGYVSLGRVDRTGDGASPDRQPETTWSQTGPVDIYKLEDTHVFGSSFVLTGRIAHVDGGFDVTPSAGSAVPVQDVFSQTIRGGFFGAESDRASTAYHLDGSHFMSTGAIDHDFKFGVDYRRFTDTTRFTWPAGTLTVVDDPFFEPIAVFPPSTTTAVEMDYTSFYVQDTLTYGNLTAYVGLRFDRQSGHNLPSTVEANPFRPFDVPGGAYGGADAAFEWETISPRVGVTYALGDERKTLLRASYARFADQLGTRTILFTNPVEGTGPLLGSQAFRYIDVNGNDRYDDGEPNGQPQILGGLTADQAGFYQTDNVVDPDLSSPYTDEFTIGVDREVAENVVVGATFVYRQRGDILFEQPFIADPFDGVRTITPADFGPGNPIQGVDASGTPFDVATQKLIAPRQFTGGSYLSNGTDYTQEYLGLELYWQKRLSNRWMLAAHVTMHDWSWNVPDAAFKDGNDLLGSFDNDGAPVAPASEGAFKSVFLDADWQASIRAAYALPFGVDLGTNVRMRQGYPVPQFVVGDPGDGKTRRIQVGGFDDQRLDSLFVADVRVRKTFDVGRVHLEALLDVRNLTGSQTVLQRQGDLTSPGGGQAIEFVDPRRYFLGARLRF